MTALFFVAPHPKAALLAANFSISKEAQTFLAKFGRLPTRPDVETNPPGVLDGLKNRKVVTVLLNTEEDRRRIRQLAGEVVDEFACGIKVGILVFQGRSPVIQDTSKTRAQDPQARNSPGPS